MKLKKLSIAFGWLLTVSAFSKDIEIDSKIRKSRTKLEAKLLSDVKKSGVITPVLYDVDLENTTSKKMLWVSK